MAKCTSIVANRLLCHWIRCELSTLLRVSMF